MKTKTITLLIILLTIAALSYVRAEDKAYALTPDEAQAWAQLQQNEKANAEAYQAAVIRAVDTLVGANSQAVHAAVQSGWLAMN